MPLFSLKKENVEFAKSTVEKKNKNSVMKRTVENNSDVLSAITSPLLTYEMVNPVLFVPQFLHL